MYVVCNLAGRLPTLCGKLFTPSDTGADNLTGTDTINIQNAPSFTKVFGRLPVACYAQRKLGSHGFE